MRVLAIQLQTVDGQVDANYERAFALLAQGAEMYRPDVVILPELFAVAGVAEDLHPFAEDVSGPTVSRFAEYSRRYGMMVLVGIIRKAGENLYNSIVLVDRGEVIGFYDKTHLVMEHRPERKALCNEQDFYVPGDKLGLFDTRFGRIGIMICHDGEYPEVPRALAIGGAQAIFWPINNGELSSWAKLHARWNTTPVFSCNRVWMGDDGVRKGGGSIFVDIYGNAWDSAGTSEAFVFADVDLAEQAKFRDAAVTPQANLFRVRRPDLYRPLAEDAGE